MLAVKENKQQHTGLLTFQQTYLKEIIPKTLCRVNSKGRWMK